MIVMPVPKDIRTIEAKFIGPFTKRQTMAIGLASVIAFGLYILLGKYMIMDSLMGLIVIIDAPILACGFIDLYGMPLWVYAKDVFISRVLYPKYRPYQTENTYAAFSKQNRITYEFFDGDTQEYSKKQMKRKSKENKKRLERFLKENPNLKPIE